MVWELRDLGPIVNFFSKVSVESDGSMKFVPGNSKPGDYVELRAEMNLLVHRHRPASARSQPGLRAEAREVFRYARGPGDG